MFGPNSSPPSHMFSLLLAAVLALQAAGGLVIPGLYRDNTWIVSTYRATDLATLFLIVPLLLESRRRAYRGSARAQLIWLGVLYYVFYNNLYFILGTAFNKFFLVYVTVFVLSSFALVAAILQTDGAAIERSARPRTPRRLVAGIMITCAAVLVIMWVGQSIAYLVTGTMPQLINDTGGITHIIAALDLTTIVPPLVLGALWLWRSRPWGYVVSVGMLTQCSLITIALVAAAPFQAAAGIPGAWMMVPLWALMLGGFLGGALLLLKDLPSSTSRGT